MSLTVMDRSPIAIVHSCSRLLVGKYIPMCAVIAQPGMSRIRRRTEGVDDGKMVMYGSREASHRAIVLPLALMDCSGRSGRYRSSPFRNNL